ncbi:hypothetical protein [Chryseobacterium sp. G0162]|uniref:hypothetical protein n=1 Tax=Chryseobacterium sp. G0162 TaxID=2487063 RepID=UPI0013DE3EC5|nr:hypothetical protein [Chryseobacterium sp. G0162]
MNLYTLLSFHPQEDYMLFSAVQNENKGIKFVTQAFLELMKQHNLKIECKLKTPNKAY